MEGPGTVHLSGNLAPDQVSLCNQETHIIRIQPPDLALPKVKKADFHEITLSMKEENMPSMMMDDSSDDEDISQLEDIAFEAKRIR